MAISADVKAWEEQEAKRKAAALDKVMQFKAMRESQVKDKEERLQRVRSLLLPSPYHKPYRRICLFFALCMLTDQPPSIMLLSDQPYHDLACEALSSVALYSATWFFYKPWVLSRRTWSMAGFGGCAAGRLRMALRN